MNKLLKLLLNGFYLLIFFGAGCSHLQNTDKNAAPNSVSSPDKKLVATFELANGSPKYFITYEGKEILSPSELGVKLGDESFYKSLRVVEVSKARVINDSYKMSHGKKASISYRAIERRFVLQNESLQSIAIRFRVSNNGVAFRYEFPDDQTQVVVSVEEEFTSFTFPENTRAWLQPVAVAQTGWNNTNPSYEEHYQMDIPVGQASPSSAGWVFPALFKTEEKWLAITEAGMSGNYHASRLQAESPNGEYRIGYPMAAEVSTGGALKAQDKRPFHSPWRIIAIGSLEELVESTLGTDLADPAIKEMHFVKPGLVSWSWALLKDDSVNFGTQKEFIDYAADMGWPYTLVDADWDHRIGEEKIQELARYASSKNVELLLWYNSSGNWNTTPLTPKSKLLTRSSRRAEFEKLQRWGIKGVKIDFFAGDGQSMMQYYNELAQDAADFGLMLNYHGSSLPRGLSRTYPNLLTMESVHGFEMITFMQNSADKAPSHMTMLPFTRNLFDPMDFTPTTFGEIPGIERRTTNGFELALPVLFLSGLQHIAETPEGMANVPSYVKEVMKTIPVLWDDSRLVQGYPGKEVISARRKGRTWYVAGINGEAEAKTWNLDLSFTGAQTGTLITDGDQPGSFKRETTNLSTATRIEVKPSGGFLMTIQAP